MKRRTGFVSNSSSSSFIIGAGIIKDRKALNKYLLDNNCIDWDYKITNASEIMATEDGWSNEKIKNNSVIVTACVNSEPEISLELKEEDFEKELLIINVGNNEGDSAFYPEDDNGWFDLNYDKVDENYFDSSQKSLIDVLSNKNIIERSSGYSLGADRNG